MRNICSKFNSSYFVFLKLKQSVTCDVLIQACNSKIGRIIELLARLRTSRVTDCFISATTLSTGKLIVPERIIGSLFNKQLRDRFKSLFRQYKILTLTSMYTPKCPHVSFSHSSKRLFSRT